MERNYTVREAADYFSVTPYTICKWIREKRIPAFKASKEYRIKQSDIDNFCKANSTKSINN